MSRKVHRYYAIRLREFGNLVFPKVAIATPAMNKEERRLSLARDRIVNRNTVRSINNFRGWLGLDGRKRKRKQQEES